MSREKKVTLRDHASYWSVNDVIKNVEITLKFERDLMILRHLLNIHNLSFHDSLKKCFTRFLQIFLNLNTSSFHNRYKILISGNYLSKTSLRWQTFSSILQKKKMFSNVRIQKLASLHFAIRIHWEWSHFNKIFSIQPKSYHFHIRIHSISQVSGNFIFIDP